MRIRVLIAAAMVWVSESPGAAGLQLLIRLFGIAGRSSSRGMLCMVRSLVAFHIP